MSRPNSLFSNPNIYLGSEVSFMCNSQDAFLYCLGIADPALYLRPISDDPEEPVRDFERCVFSCRRINEWQAQAGGSVITEDVGELTYGTTVCLVHAYTETVVCVNRKEASAQDKKCMRVSLQPKHLGGTSCFFKVLPKYKIRSEGDPVRHGDHIIFQHTACDVYLHSSEEEEGDLLEVNAGDVFSTWTIQRYDCMAGPEKNNSNNSLQVLAGRAVVFLHKELDSLMTAGACFLGTKTQKVKKRAMAPSVHEQLELSSPRMNRLRSRSESQSTIVPETTTPFFLGQINKASSVDISKCSCNSLWVIEAKNPTKGGPIRPYEPHRIRHAATGRYLSVDTPEDGMSSEEGVSFHVPQLQLVEPPLRGALIDATLFAIEPLHDEHISTIPSSSCYVRIVHVATGLTLITDKAPQLQNRHTTQIEVSHHWHYDDAIAIVSVSMSTQQKLNGVIGNIEFLMKYVKLFDSKKGKGTLDFLQSPSTRNIIKQCQKSLRSLIEFCTQSEEEDVLIREGLPIRHHQQVLFDLQVHTLSFDVLQCPFSSREHRGKLTETKVPFGGVMEMEKITKKEFADVHMVCRLCYRLQKQMCKRSGYFSSLLKDYIPFMESQEGYKLHVADTLLAIFTDNQDLPSHMSKTACEHFIYLLREKGRSAGYVKFLSTLCVVKGTGVTANQHLVCQMLLKENKLLVMLPVVELDVLSIDSGGLEEFLLKGDTKMIRYFDSCVELCSKLSIGADPETIAALRELIPPEQIIAWLNLSQRLRKNPSYITIIDTLEMSYMSLAMHLYLTPDLHGGDRMKRPLCFLYVVGVVANEPVSGACINGLTDNNLTAALKKSSLEILRSHTAQVADAPSMNDLLTTLVSMWHLIVIRKQYTTDEIRGVVDVLLQVLDISTDIIPTAHGNESERFALTENMVTLFKTKQEICKTFTLLLTHVVDDIATTIIGAIAERSVVDRASVQALTQTTVRSMVNAIIPSRCISVLIALSQCEALACTQSALQCAVMLCSVRRRVGDCLRLTTIIPYTASKTVDNIRTLTGVLLSGDDTQIGHALQSLAALYKADAEDDFENLENESFSGTVSLLCSVTAVIESDPVSRKRDRNAIVRHFGTHLLICEALKSHGSEWKHRRKAMECAHHMCQSASNAEDMAPYVTIFVDFFDVGPLSLSVVIYIIVHFRCLTHLLSLDRDVLSCFVTRVVKENDAELIRVLEHFVVADYPIAAHQRLVMSTILQAGDELEKAKNANGSWTAEALQLNHAYMGLVVCCAVGNSATRTQAQRVLGLSDVIKVLINDTTTQLPNEYQVPYFHYLRVVCFGRDEDCTPQERLNAQKDLLGNKSWWVLLGRMVKTIQTISRAATVNRGDRPPYAAVLLNAMIMCLKTFFQERFSIASAHRGENATLISLVISVIGEMMGSRIVQEEEVTVPQVLLDTLVRIELEVTKTHTLRDALHLPKKRSSQYLLREKKKVEADTTEDIVACVASELTQEDVMPLTQTLCGSPRALIEKIICHCAQYDLDVDTIVGILFSLRCYLTDGTRDEDALAAAQNSFDEMGAMKASIQLVEAADDEVVHHALCLGCAVLEGGNVQVQDNLLVYLTTHDERCFGAVHKAILDAIAEVKRINSSRDLINATATSRAATSFKFIVEMFRLTQLMCEGHHLGLQNYIRSQHDNLHSINVLRDVLNFCTELTTCEVEPNMLKILCRGFALLTELCQGPCRENQTVLVSSNVCAMINAVLHSAPFALENVESFGCGMSSSKDNALIEAKSSAAITLLSLLEGRNDPAIAKIILSQVSVSSIAIGINTYQKALVGARQEEPTFLDLVTNLMIYIRQMASFPPDTYLEGQRAQIDSAIDSFQNMSDMIGVIEIERGTFLELVYFRIPSICTANLTDARKHTVLWTVDRSTHSSKITDFFDKSDELILDIENQHAMKCLIDGFTNLTARSPGSPLRRTAVRVWNYVTSTLFQQTAERFDNASLAIAVVINVIFLTCVSDPREFLDSDHEWFGVEGLVVFLGACQVFITAMLMTLEGATVLPLEVYKARRAAQKNNKLKGMPAEPETDLTIKTASGALVLWVGLSTKPLWFRFVGFVAAVIGLLCSPYFLSIHLFVVVPKSSILQNVIVAVTQNGKSLLMTFGFGVVIMYIFSIIGFVFFPTDFDESDEAGVKTCATLGQCFLFILSRGIRSGGGIGELMKPATFESPNHYRRLFYDFFFFALMIVIFLNILFGIIIDTFAELRDQKREIEEDINSQCFICGLDASLFERDGEGFQKHQDKEHNMWNYLYFMHHLRRKDKNEYTGQESFVALCIAMNDMSFFPTDRCGSLERKKGLLLESKAQESESTTTLTDSQNLTSLVASLEETVGELRSLKSAAAADKTTPLRGSVRPTAPPPASPRTKFKAAARVVQMVGQTTTAAVDTTTTSTLVHRRNTLTPTDAAVDTTSTTLAASVIAANELQLQHMESASARLEQESALHTLQSDISSLRRQNQTLTEDLKTAVKTADNIKAEAEALRVLRGEDSRAAKASHDAVVKECEAILAESASYMNVLSRKIDERNRTIQELTQAGARIGSPVPLPPPPPERLSLFTPPSPWMSKK